MYFYKNKKYRVSKIHILHKILIEDDQFCHFFKNYLPSYNYYRSLMAFYRCYKTSKSIHSVYYNTLHIKSGIIFSYYKS